MHQAELAYQGAGTRGRLERKRPFRGIIGPEGREAAAADPDPLPQEGQRSGAFRAVRVASVLSGCGGGRGARARARLGQDKQVRAGWTGEEQITSGRAEDERNMSGSWAEYERKMSGI